MARKKATLDPATPPNRIILDEGVWLEEVSLADLKPNDYNPNEMSAAMFARLKERIATVGFRDPILIRPNMVITDGEHRWKALMEEGREKSWVIVADEDEMSAMIETIDSNLIKGEFNPVKYGELLNKMIEKMPLDELKALIPTPGVQIEALSQLVKDLPTLDANEMSMPQKQQKWVTKLEFGSEADYLEVEAALDSIGKTLGQTSNAATVLYLTRNFRGDKS